MERRYEQRAAFGTRRHEKGTFSTGISHETGVPAYVASGLEHEMYVASYGRGKRYYSQNTKVCRSIAEQKVNIV